jgi:uncharacterized membrane protein (DUF373 family)
MLRPVASRTSCSYRVDPRHRVTQHKAPDSLERVNRLTIVFMTWFNELAHILISLSLAIAVFMFTWLFFHDVYASAASHQLLPGFLHALGTLMLLWVISALIMAEIRYLRGNPLGIDTFVEVTVVVILRKLIVLPVQETSPAPSEVLMWVGAAFLMGVMYLVVRWARQLGNPDPTKNEEQRRD